MGNSAVSRPTIPCQPPHPCPPHTLLLQVPISLVYRKGLARLDGSDPVLLNGYGSYEV